MTDRDVVRKAPKPDGGLRMTTERSDHKQVRDDLNPVEIFLAFLFFVPTFGALLHLLVHNLLEPSTLAWSATFNVAGIFLIGEATFVFVSGVPAAFFVAIGALASFLVYRRVSLIVVLAATFAAVGLGNFVMPYAYAAALSAIGPEGLSYIGSIAHSVSYEAMAPLVSDLLMHVVPTSKSVTSGRVSLCSDGPELLRASRQ
jgi:hypothetical protein